MRSLLTRFCAAALALVAAAAGASAATVGQLPPGPNRDLVAGVCGACHGTEYLTESAGLSRDDWRSVLKGMGQFGLTLQPAEREKILDYLAVYLGPHPPPAAHAQMPAAPSGPQPIGPYLSKADPAAGKRLTAVCAVCHSFAKGGPNKIGPNLFATVGSKLAADRNGFTFSAALKQHEGVWTIERLNRWLYSPQDFAPGTSMSFSGIKDAQQRADVIAYLRSAK